MDRSSVSGAAASRRYVRLGIVAGILAALVILWLTGLLATVVPRESALTTEDVLGGGLAFDPVKYVDGIWDSKVLPIVEADTLDLELLVTALERDAAEAGKTYGNDVGGAYNFLAHFTGRVSQVDSGSLTGTVTVDAEVGGGVLPVRIQIGPIILGTALRDAVKFIRFQQFTNQIQYGGVSDEMNGRVSRLVIAKLDLDKLLGKTVSVKGAFTYDFGATNPKDILVTPVFVTAEPE